ncbi:MAG TPA: hypothetical protein VKV26_04110 [Dehalococcoidia bacterium]|nr:hypothetical protein [Dehalococcoidia bacterium]
MAALAAVGPVGELLLLPDGGGAPITLAHPEVQSPLVRPAPFAYSWPTWTADGAALLVATIEAEAGGQPPAQLLRIETRGEAVASLFRSPEGGGMLGPRMPYYVNPSPDARHVALLAPTPMVGLTLLFLDAEGRGPAQGVARGAPLFSAWSPRSDALLLHVGGEISLLELATAPATQTFASNHTGYRVPAWSADGESFAVCAADGPRFALQRFDRAGKKLEALAESASTAAFTWSPDGAYIALAQLLNADPPRYTGLRLVGLDGAAERRARCGECLAFVWSPSGERLAVLLPTPRDGHVAWLVIDRDGEPVRRFPAFEPSPEFSMAIAFFDQYALSHRLWSADGTRLLACGRMQLNGTPPELLGPTIYVHDLRDGATRSVASGVIAFWSPRPDASAQPKSET